MKILNIGLDNSMLNKNSDAARRLVEYGNAVEKYDAIVPSRKKVEVELSVKTKVCGSGGRNKLSRFYKIYNIGEKLFGENRYDVITVQDQYYLALIGLSLSKKFKTGLEIQAHGFEEYRGLRKLIARYVLPRADSVRCVSRRLKTRLVNEFGVNEEKITVANIYSEIKNQKFETRNYGIRNKFIFLAVGRLAPVKNIGMQIEAVKDVVKKYQDIELWIIGDGPEREKLKAKSKKLKVEDKIKFFGWQNDSDKFYRQADAFVLSSDSEGWGLAVIEAAGHGLPIIMTDVGCAGEAIKNRESGLVVPAGDKKKLVESMIEIFENAELRKKLGESAKLAVSKLPNKEQILGLYKKSWEKAVG